MRKLSVGDIVEGRLLRKKLHGFVDCKNSVSVFISKRHLYNTMTYDIVRVEVTDTSHSKGANGKIIGIVSAYKQILIGQVDIQEKEVWFVPINPNFPNMLISNLESKKILEKHKISQRDWIIVQLNDREILHSNRLVVEFIKYIGQQKNLDIELLALRHEFNLLNYSKDWESFAKEIVPYRGDNRKVIEDHCILTIDPSDAKDFDDAVSIVHSDEKTITVAIHIADVASYIPPDSELMKEIVERCFTAYMPNGMFPMLPRYLVNKKCSLKQGEKKFAHTVEISYDRNSLNILSSKRYPSEIVVTKRLSYGVVQKFVNSQYKEVLAEWTDDIRDSVEVLCKLAIRLREKRSKQEFFLPFERSEYSPKISNNSVVGINKSSPDEAKQLIEEFMLAANVEVAKEMYEKKIPCPYRVHPSPDNDSYESLLDSISKFFVFNDDLNDRKNFCQLLEKVNKSNYRQILSLVVLRTMKRATYNTEKDEHFGLGKETYCHFTSPIRRLSDLLVHQQLLYSDNNKYPYSEYEIQEYNEQINFRETEVDYASRLANRRFLLHYIKDKFLNKEVEMSIFEIMDRGVSGLIEEWDMKVFISYENFFSDHFVVSKERDYIRGRKKKKKYSLGEKIKTTVLSVSLDDYEITLGVY